MLVAVADDVFRLRGATDRSSQKRTEFAAVGPFGKHADAHDAAGEMVDDHTHPPAEREVLWQRKGQPRDPESQTRRYGGQINVPSVIAASGDDLSPGGLNAAIWSRLRCRIFAQHPSNRRRAQMQPGPCQRLRDLDLAHGGTEGLQPLDDVSDEIRKAIDGQAHLDQGIRTFLIQTPQPGSNRGCRDVKHAGCLLQRPTTGRLEFQDRQSFGWWIVWTSMRIDRCHAGILDPGFLTQQGELLYGAIALGRQSDS